MGIPYFDLTRQYAEHKRAFEKHLARVASSGKYILGQEVEEFERAFAAYCGTRQAVGVGSGTDALTFTLKALGLKKGDEVIVPSFTFMATVFSIIHAGATPVFAEVNPKSYCLDPDSVLRALTKRTRALLPVHLYGHPADMTGLGSIARKHRLHLVEDACQAHGATWRGKRTGSFGDAGCFSFYPTKNLGALGDGGMVVTSDSKLALTVRRLRNLGRINLSEQPQVLGVTSRLDALQAAVLREKLRHLESFTRLRRSLVDRYRKVLRATPLILPEQAPGAKHVYHLLVVRVPGGRRQKLREHLTEAGVTTLIHYPVPVHKMKIVAKHARQPFALKFTEKISDEILTLPLFPEMKPAEVDRVGKVIRSFYAR